MFCTNCGQPNDDAAKFCTSCGNRLVSEPGQGRVYEQAQEPQSWECSFCGSLNDADCIFCTFCGQRFAAGDTDEWNMAGEETSSPSAYAQLEAVASAPDTPEVDAQNRSVHGHWVAVTVIIAISVILIGGGLLWYGYTQNASHNASEATEATETANGSDSTKRKKESKESEKDKNESSSSTSAKKTLDRKTMDALVNPYDTGSGKVAVSVMTSDKTASYSSEHAYLSMSSAGLYLPPWLDYYDRSGSSPATDYSAALTSMDNDKANDLIDAVGGLDALNNWLDARGYNSTHFGHHYGDVETAGSGYQNTTSSDDAARMLTAMIAKGDDGLLNYDVTTDGVSVPAGATVHAHRGMGVGDAYDYYMVVSNGSRKVAVVVLTQNHSKEQAASLASGVLRQVWNNMLSGGK